MSRPQRQLYTLPLPDVVTALIPALRQVGNLLTYPDFEQNFSLFEPLRGMRVRLHMEGASAADCAALLGGLSVPLLSGAAAEEALAEIAAEAARRARG